MGGEWVEMWVHPFRTSEPVGRCGHFGKKTLANAVGGLFYSPSCSPFFPSDPNAGIHPLKSDVWIAYYGFIPVSSDPSKFGVFTLVRI